MTAPEAPSATPTGAAPRVFAAARVVIAERCAPCHSTAPTQPGIAVAPAGVVFDTPRQIQAWAPRIRERAVVARTMPLANVTGMTDEERALLERWIAAGAHCDKKKTQMADGSAQHGRHACHLPSAICRLYPSSRSIHRRLRSSGTLDDGGPMTRRTVTTPVYEVMTREPITVTPATPIGELLSLFARHDFNAFPVLDDGGALRGIVTKLDVLRLFRPDPALRIADYPTLSTAHVADIMRRGIVSVEPEDPLIVAAA
jgi:CBS domain-containing protein